MALNPADIAVVSQLLDQALALPSDERQAWLDALPAEHHRHRDTLRDMLAQEDELDADPRLDVMPKLALDESVAHQGDRVGPYRLIKEIGRGGMGTVWLAERADGAYKRQVALKLPRLAWGAGLAERMAREREIGMLLEHPNIARLYDAGVDERGRPFLALEFVDGQPIDAWCEAQGLNVRDRLKLFVQVIKAVGYAHGRLVVHRDLKPSNVLVTPDGQAHLLDFGIAKLLLEAAPGEAGLTQEQGRVLTPHYAAPEQVTGEAITVQSDVYSLGVLLYELLTGTLPIAPLRSTLGAVEEAILEGDAPLASSRVKDRIAARALRGEVDAILAQAMQREPGRRYATADAMALDIERHLNGETVAARPDSRLYRLRKAVRRNWVAVSAAGAVLLAVFSGGGVAVIQVQRAARSAERERVIKEFVTDVFRVNAFRGNTGSGLQQSSSDDLLDQGAQLIEVRFAQQPEMQAELFGVVGRAYANIGLNRQAIIYASRQIQILNAAPSNLFVRVRALLLLSEISFREDRNAEAQEYARQATEAAHGDFALELEALARLAGIFLEKGQIEDANRIALTASGIAKSKELSQTIGAALLLSVQSQLLAIRGSLKDAEVLFRLALDTALRVEGVNSPTAVDLRISRARNLLVLDPHAYKIARKMLEAALSVLRSSGGANEIRASMIEAHFATLLVELNEISLSEAINLIERARSLLGTEATHAPKESIAQLDFWLGRVYLDRGHLAEAERLLPRSAEIVRVSTQSLKIHRELSGSLAILANFRGNYELADALFRDVSNNTRAQGLSNTTIEANDIFFIAWNLAMAMQYDRADHVLDDAASLLGIADLNSANDSIRQIIREARARVRLDRGDLSGALSELPELTTLNFDDRQRRPWEQPLYAEVQCVSGGATKGLPLIIDWIQWYSAIVSDIEPYLNWTRATAGLCALAIGERSQAHYWAALARRAFIAQPDVNPYFKAPLFKLERALGLKMPPV
jgi:serine/threonine-protein kinase